MLDLMSLSVIPCKDKVSLVPWKPYQDDPPTPEEKAIWHKQWPDAQWALICGQVSGGICVFDVDDKDVAKKMMEEQKGVTRMHRTPSGGLHCFIREVDSLSPSKPLIAGKFDLKSNGGYVIIPPSPKYTVIDESEILEVSSGESHCWEWLQRMGFSLTADPLHKPSVEEMFKDGNRDVALTSVAGSLRRYGLDEESIFQALKIVNQTQCQPPVEEFILRKIAVSIGHKATPGAVYQSSDQSLTLTQIQQRRQGATVIPYSVDWLNDYLGGARGGEIVVVGARTGDGKTSFAVSWLYQLAEKNIPCAFLSLEETREEILSRMAVIMYQDLHPKRLDMAKLEPRDWEMLQAFDGAAASWSAVIRDNLMLGASEAEKFLDVHPVKVVFLDHIQLAAHKGRDERQSLDEEIRAWKRIAVERDLVVVMLSQLNRNIYQRDTSEPTCADLKSTGLIEQMASQVLLLWQPEGMDEHSRILKVAKNRRGRKHEGLGLAFTSHRRMFKPESFFWTPPEKKSAPRRSYGD